MAVQAGRHELIDGSTVELVQGLVLQGVCMACLVLYRQQQQHEREQDQQVQAMVAAGLY